MKTTILPLNIPKNRFSAREIERMINNALEETAKAIKVDYKVTTRTWKNKPDFKISKSGKWERSIYTNDLIYLFVDKGTKPHIIKPKNKPFLAFKWAGYGSYKAATRPNHIGSRKAQQKGDYVYRKKVKHPGTKPRNFAKVITKKWRKQWPRQLQRAIMSL